MKKVFSSLILVVAWPFKYLKRFKLDNFVGGLIFGAIFSLIVNVVTVQIQETIQRQRTYEAIEKEILGNLVTASQTLDRNKPNIEKFEPLNMFYVSAGYSDDFWSQSSEAISYISQLDVEKQSFLVIYYTNTIRNANLLIAKANKLIDDYTTYCFPIGGTTPSNRVEECKVKSYVIYSTENLAAESVLQESNKALNVFTPTSDKLNNWFLKFLVGNSSGIQLEKNKDGQRK